MTDISSIKRRILKKRGLRESTPANRKHHNLSASITSIMPDSSKTTLMKMLELKHHDHIENILSSGSLKHIEKKYGIDYTTASKWRKLLAAEALKQLSPTTLKSLVGGIIEDTQYEGVHLLDSAQGEGDYL